MKSIKHRTCGMHRHRFKELQIRQVANTVSGTSKGKETTTFIEINDPEVI